MCSGPVRELVYPCTGVPAYAENPYPIDKITRCFYRDEHGAVTRECRIARPHLAVVAQDRIMCRAGFSNAPDRGGTSVEALVAARRQCLRVGVYQFHEIAASVRRSTRQHLVPGVQRPDHRLVVKLVSKNAEIAIEQHLWNGYRRGRGKALCSDRHGEGPFLCWLEYVQNGLSFYWQPAGRLGMQDDTKYQRRCGGQHQRIRRWSR